MINCKQCGGNINTVPAICVILKKDILNNVMTRKLLWGIGERRNSN